MLELSSLDLGEIAAALQDQTVDDYRWLIDPESGQLSVWTEDGGIDGHTSVDLDDVDLLPIEPLPPWVWYQDMVDFTEGISDERAGHALARAIQGKGAFRRFADRLHQDYPQLLPAWHAFRAARAERRALQWLADNSLIDDQAAARALTHHPDPTLP